MEIAPIHCLLLLQEYILLSDTFRFNYIFKERETTFNPETMPQWLLLIIREKKAIIFKAGVLCS